MKKLLLIPFLCILAFGQVTNPPTGGTGGVTITTVAGLSTVPGKTNGTVASVTNGNSSTDCTVGGGSTTVVCQFNGSVWSAVSAAGSAPAFSTITSGNNITAAMGIGTGATLVTAGVGQNASSELRLLTNPAPVTLTGALTGGNLATGHIIYVQISFNEGASIEGSASQEFSISLGPATGCASGIVCTVTVTAPVLPTGVTGYTVYDSDNVSGSEKRQAASAACFNITINCVIGTIGAGASPLNYTNMTFPLQPSPLGSSGLCGPGLTPWVWAQSPVDGAWNLIAGLDPTQYVNMPGAHLNICNPTFISNGGKLPLYGHNGLFVVIDQDGAGIDHTTNDNRAFDSIAVVDSNYVGGATSTTMDQYGEVDLNGAPNLQNDIITPLNESVDVVTGTVGDARTGCTTNCGGPFVGGRFSYTFTGVGGPTSWVSTNNVTGLGLEASAQIATAPTVAIPSLVAAHFDWFVVSGQAAKVNQAVGAQFDYPSSSSTKATTNVEVLLEDQNNVATGNADYGIFEGKCGSGNCFPIYQAPTQLKNIFSGEIGAVGGFLGGVAANQQLAAPTLNSISCAGGSGTNYTYRVGAVDENGRVGTLSAAQSGSCGATLGGAVTATLQLAAPVANPVVGAYTCNAYRTASSGTPATTGLIGTFQCAQGSFIDNGLAVTDAYIPPATANLTGSVGGFTYASNTNCAVNSVSPAACGTAAAGAVVVPTTTATYTINTTAVTPHSRIFLMPMSFAGDLPSAPTCVVPAITVEPTITAIVGGTSFSFALASTTGQTCWQYFVIN